MFPVGKDIITMERMGVITWSLILVGVALASCTATISHTCPKPLSLPEALHSSLTTSYEQCENNNNAKACERWNFWQRFTVQQDQLKECD